MDRKEERSERGATNPFFLFSTSKHWSRWKIYREEEGNREEGEDKKDERTCGLLSMKAANGGSRFFEASRTWTEAAAGEMD
ncbi:hypothetical protein OPV22_014454 [Ensete ventricosum]|uniref:Uncharacterized protein n=1 Tax=Ensete ventricosum TaxID=4639 RepID=A0AAV8R9R1_ENSVE|nr:hypothetical protein OPV22_014454 [Ensete ventricosum]